MFSALRQNSNIYILDKNNVPTLKIGQVVNISTPQFYGINQTVDITVNTNGENIDFKKIPANLSVANINNVIISENQDNLSIEVESMIRNSKEIIDNIDYHKSVITAGEDILKKLNPKFAKDKEQEEKINNLENTVTKMQDNIQDIKTMLQNVLNK